MAVTPQAMLLRRALAIVVAGAVGAAAGVFAVSFLGAKNFMWSGLALLPLFVLLESLLKQVVSSFHDDRNAARMWLAGAIVVCFYATWGFLSSR